MAKRCGRLVALLATLVILGGTLGLGGCSSKPLVVKPAESTSTVSSTATVPGVVASSAPPAVDVKSADDAGIVANTWLKGQGKTGYTPQSRAIYSDKVQITYGKAGSASITVSVERLTGGKLGKVTLVPSP